jgi:hypothetical protein
MTDKVNPPASHPPAEIIPGTSPCDYLIQESIKGIDEHGREVMWNIRGRTQSEFNSILAYYGDRINKLCGLPQYENGNNRNQAPAPAPARREPEREAPPLRREQEYRDGGRRESEYREPPRRESEPERYEDDGREPNRDRAPICEAHRVEMKLRHGKRGESFWSCNQKNRDGSWCNYRPPKRQDY